jgi:hypothetical protein
MGPRPSHFPKTEVRIAWEPAALHLRFRVEDCYVRARAVRHQESVCRDSCVEFFFTPGPDPSRGYFNVEVNCGGTVLFHYQPRPRQGEIEIPRAVCERMVTAHTLPCQVDPEIATPITWEVQYRLPFALLAGYCPVDGPGPRTLWRANFYKCADQTSHPHWLTWAPVDHPRPDFHRPEAFGNLVFL